MDLTDVEYIAFPHAEDADPEDTGSLNGHVGESVGRVDSGLFFIVFSTGF